jgi:hypothetical protein
MKKYLLVLIFGLVLLIPVVNYAAPIKSAASGSWSATKTWYKTMTGTISASTDSMTVTGSGTLFITELAIGDSIRDVNGVALGAVSTITNNVALVLTAMPTATYSGTYIANRVPTSSDNVTVANGHMIAVPASQSCNDLTILSGGRINTTSNSITTNNLTIHGTLVLQSGAYWYQAGSGAFISNGSMAFDPHSTVEFSGTQAKLVTYSYGNLIWGSTTTPAWLDSALTVNGDFTINAGRIYGFSYPPTSSDTLTGRTHTVAGNIIVNDVGDFVFGGGTNNTSFNTVRVTWNIGGSVTLNGTAVIRGWNGSSTQGQSQLSSATLNIAGDLTLNNSTFLRFGNAINNNGTVNVNVGGSLINAGTIERKSGSIGSMNINFNGTLPQIFSNTGGTLGKNFTPALSCTLKIDNAAGVTLTSPDTLPSYYTLNLTKGVLHTTVANMLIFAFDSANVINGGSATSFIDGPMTHTIASTALTSKTFPVGKSTVYRPVTITITQTTGTATTYTAEVFNNAPLERTLPGTIDKISSVRYWNLAKGTGANIATASVQLIYDTSDGVNDIGNIRIAKDDGAGAWIDLGGTGSANPVGSITSTNTFTSLGDFVLANYLGGTNLTDVKTTSQVVPKIFALSNNYPNPFNPSTSFTYQLGKAGFVSVKIYDVLGREVAKLVNELKQAGTYPVEWNAVGVSSGVYFCRMQTESFAATKKMILMK